jgi:hypothetical protein
MKIQHIRMGQWIRPDIHNFVTIYAKSNASGGRANYGASIPDASYRPAADSWRPPRHYRAGFAVA